LRSLEEEVFEIKVDPEVLEKARLSLERMMRVPRDN
jgi:quinolinate synthase